MEDATQEETTERKGGKRGRKPLQEGEDTVQRATKFHKTLDDQMVEAISTLNAMGYDCDMSKLIRRLCEYRVSNAVYIFKEMEPVRKD